VPRLGGAGPSRVCRDGPDGQKRLPISALQSEYSLSTRCEAEAKLPTLRELGLRHAAAWTGYFFSLTSTPPPAKANFTPCVVAVRVISTPC
jgi:hypothetical protein